MITKIISSGLNANGTKYDKLFEEANKALNATEEDKITTLNDYFVRLNEIVLNEDIYHPKFITLPADEDLFEINANTRTIKVPDIFKSGAGVEGDQIAETIFFSIDRYFDTMDLNNQSIQIEWKAPGQSGISSALAKDTDSIPNKIIFGWGLREEITSEAGSIEFAVRFYTIDPDTK